MGLPEPDSRAGDAAFFGRMAASVSHDIKNSLAVIKEQAGLAGDLLGGTEPDLARIRTLLEKILRRVDVADEVVRNLNRFAHSADVTSRAVDLHEAVDLLLRLTRRFAQQRRLAVDLHPAPAPVPVRVGLFHALQALFLVLEGLAGDPAEPGGVSIAVRRDGASAACDFRRTPAPDPDAAGTLSEVLPRRFLATDVTLEPGPDGVVSLRFPLAADPT
jgi:C4-dicarboxylate-specific signal transduction histidine kinase